MAAVVGCGLIPAAASAATPPKLLGSVSDGVNLSGATSVAVSGNFAYSTAYYAGELTAVDISNPSHPVVAGSSAPNSNLLNADTVTISGNYAFVVSKNRNASTTVADDGTGNALTILDIHSNPAHPAVVGTVRDPNLLFGAYGIAVQGSFAYVAAQGCVGGSQPCPTPAPGNDFVVINISNPAGPTILHTVPNTATNELQHADSVAISGHFAYVTASFSNTLDVIDISNPATADIVGHVSDATNLASANDVAVQGNFAYVADETGPAGRLAVVDVSNPASPKVVGSVVDPALNFAYRVRVRGNFAYVSSSMADTISMIDISNPASPKVAATVHDATHLHRTTGLDFVLTGRYLVASSPYLSSETQTNYPPFPLQAGGPSATGTVSVIDVDPSPVSVNITSPANATNYGKGQAVRARYSCTPGGFIPLASCTGPVASGASINTSTPGKHTFTVTGTDQDGQTGTATVTYSVGGAAVTSLHQSAKVWREHGPKHAKHRPPLGTKFTFALSQSASVTLSFTQTAAGRKVNGRCVAPTKKNRHKHPCRRIVVAGTLTVGGHSGVNMVSFAGKIHGRFLKPGRYTLVVTASAGGTRSAPKTVTFTIVR